MAGHKSLQTLLADSMGSLQALRLRFLDSLLVVQDSWDLGVPEDADLAS